MSNRYPYATWLHVGCCPSVAGPASDGGRSTTKGTVLKGKLIFVMEDHFDTKAHFGYSLLQPEATSAEPVVLDLSPSETDIEPFDVVTVDNNPVDAASDAGSPVLQTTDVRSVPKSMYNASQVHRFGGGGGGSSVNSPTQDREHNIREMAEVAFRNRKRREDTAGKHSILLIRVEYNGHTPTYCDEDCVKSNMWTGEKNVAGMYNEASYGAVQFEDMGDKGKVITVQVKKGTAESATTCKFWQIAAEADAAARKMGVEPKDFMHQSYYLPRTGVGHCTFGGLGFLGCGKDNCKSWI
eukprot:gene22977-5027_t